MQANVIDWLRSTIVQMERIDQTKPIGLVSETIHHQQYVIGMVSPAMQDM
jgi:hypothetical protein